jgi:hypothetical protein
MSYSIYIGNAIIEDRSEDGDGELLARFTVPEIIRHDAPSFPHDDMSNGKNGRHPGYSQWSDFCASAGLTALFFDKETGIMREHPGCFSLTPEHLAIVRAARERWQAEHPAAVPGFDFSRFMADQSKDDGVRGRDGVLARLLWLEWWMSWALANCERPAIENT